MKYLFFSAYAHRALNKDAIEASGGAELQVALLAKALAAQGKEVVLLSSAEGIQDCSCLEGVKLRTGGGFGTGKLWATLKALPRIITVLWEERPDVVTVYGWTTLLFFLALLRFIISYRLAFVAALDAEVDGAFAQEHPWKWPLLYYGMKWSDYRFGITQGQVDNFKRRGMPAQLLHLLLKESEESNHSTELFQVPSLKREIIPDSKDLELLWVARSDPVKQPFLFLELASQLPGIGCVMICSQDNPALWSKIAQRAAEIPNVALLPGVPYHQIQEFFNRAKIFVNTSTQEGFPNTFIHAALGHTAIASLNIDPDGMLDKLGSGFLAQGDLSLLRKHLLYLLEEEEKLIEAMQASSIFLKKWHNNAENVALFLEQTR